MRYSVVIPAAGSGTRMGAEVPKVLLRLQGSDSHSIIQRSVDIFCDDPLCDRIIVCVPAEWQERFAEELQAREKITLVPGGATRQESVRLGVEALSSQIEARGGEIGSTCVLVHDAARCCVSHEVVRRVVDGVVRHGAVTAAVPVFDTLNRVVDGIVRGVVDRENVWAIQTPQGFLLGELREAHGAASSAGFTALDDASVVGRIRTVHIVEGDRLNIKVTHPHDLETATRIVQIR